MLSIIPAIDLLDGKVVRLLEGDFNKKSVYSEDPLEIAKYFYECGANWVHVINLTGAKEGNIEGILELVKEISNIGLKIEVGGGVRTLSHVRKLFSCGAKRVIIGTKVFVDSAFLDGLMDNFDSEDIVIALDIKNDFVRVSGWQEDIGLRWEDAVQLLSSKGVRWLLCTDISRDGGLCGPNIDLYRNLSGIFSGNIIASGGVSSMEDISKLEVVDKIKAVVIGKAIYEKRISIKKVFSKYPNG